MAAKKKATTVAKRSATKRAAKLPGVDAIAFLEELNDGPLTFGQLLNAIREGEEWSLSEMGQKLGVSRGHVHDIESGKRVVSVERAAAWAKLLGYHPGQFVQLALQAEVDAVGGLVLRVRVEDVTMRHASAPSAAEMRKLRERAREEEEAKLSPARRERNARQRADAAARRLGA